MAFIEANIRQRARQKVLRESSTTEAIFRSQLDTQQRLSTKTYDDFLSHSHADKDLVIGMKALLESAGRSVYVDWIAQPNKSGTPITVENAAKVRNAMNRCNRLVYLHTPNSSLSKWCPWELGYFDALPKSGNRIAWVTSSGNSGSQEYLDLYKKLDHDNLTG